MSVSKSGVNLLYYQSKRVGLKGKANKCLFGHYAERYVPKEHGSRTGIKMARKLFIVKNWYTASQNIVRSY